VKGLIELASYLFHLYSKGASFFSRIYLPAPFNVLLLNLYAEKFGVNLDEAELPLERYHSLYSFFTRRLKEGVRTFSPNPLIISSPCDGVIRDSGRIEGGMLLQAKRHRYTLSELIGGENAEEFENGVYITHYLRPGDYHRFHYPVSGTVKKIIYYPGTIFPVNPSAEKKIPGLYALNERVVVIIESKYGKVALAIVGASAVGEIHINLLPSLVTNRLFGKRKLEFSLNERVRKGEELGFFGMGSTIISIAQNARVHRDIEEGMFVKTGSAIAVFNRSGE